MTTRVTALGHIGKDNPGFGGRSQLYIEGVRKAGPAIVTRHLAASIDVRYWHKADVLKAARMSAPECNADIAKSLGVSGFTSTRPGRTCRETISR